MRKIENAIPMYALKAIFCVFFGGKIVKKPRFYF